MEIICTFQLLRRVPGGRVCQALSVALAPWIAGLGGAWAIGFHADYLRTPATYLYVAGSLLTILVTNWWTNRIRAAYKSLQYCFHTTRQDWLARTEAAYESYGSAKSIGSAVCIPAFMSVALVVLTVGFPATADQWSEALGLKVLSLEQLRVHGWYDGSDRVVKVAILLGLVIPATIMFGTGLRCMVLMPLFLVALIRQPVLPLPSLIKRRFENTATVYAATSAAWCVGASLFVLLLQNDLDWLGALFCAFLFTCGVVTFFVPQVVYLTIVRRAREELDEIMYERIAGHLGIPLCEGRSSDLPEVLRQKLARELGPSSPLYIANALTHNSRWVYPKYHTVVSVGMKCGSIAIMLSRLPLRAWLGW